MRSRNLALAAVAGAAVLVGCFPPPEAPCLDRPTPGEVLSLRLWEPYDQASGSRFDPYFRPTIVGCGNADGIMAGQSLKLEVTEDLVDRMGRCSIVVARLMGDNGWEVIGEGGFVEWVRLKDGVVMAKVRKGDCEANYLLGVGSPPGTDRFASPTPGALPPAIVSRSFEALSGNCADAGIPTGTPAVPNTCADYWVASFERP
jgi:hypothetical protein